MILQFCQLANKARATIEDGLSIKELYTLFGINSHSYSIYNLKAFLWNNVFDLVKSKVQTQIPYSKILQIHKHFILEHFYTNQPKNIYFSIIDNIISNYGKDFKYFKSFKESFDWIKAISIIKNILIIDNRESISSDFFNDFYKSDFDLAQAALFFKKMNYDIKLDFGEFKLKKEDHYSICKSIEKDIEKTNGLAVINSLLHNLRQIEGLDYFINISTVSPNPSQIFPKIPLGFLLNLSVKYINSNSPNREAYDALIKKATNLAKLYDVQPHHRFEDILVSPIEIMTFLKRVALYDSLFKFPQFVHKHIPETILGIFNWISNETLTTYIEFNLEEYIKVISCLLQTKMQIFSASNIQPLGVSSKTVIIILNFMSTLHNEVNKSYQLPLDYTKVNFYKNPLIKLDNGNFLLLNKTICSESFITSFALPLFKVVPNLGSKTGKAIETFLKNFLEKRNINSYRGEYKNFNKFTGDCDLILQNDETIIFIELKMKDLTYKAKSIDENSLFFDIINSLLYMHWQTGKHSLLLKKHNHISFIDGSKLEQNNREIERIGITFSDYGSFQNTEVMQSILNAFLHISLSESTNKTKSKEFKKAQKLISNLKECTKELNSISNSEKRLSFSDCNFINLSSFLTLAQKSKNEDELIQLLLKRKHMSYGTRDFLVETFMDKIMADIKKEK